MAPNCASTCSVIITFTWLTRAAARPTSANLPQDSELANLISAMVVPAKAFTAA